MVVPSGQVWSQPTSSAPQLLTASWGPLRLAPVGDRLKVLVLQKPRHHPLTGSGLGLRGSLYITPLLAEQKIEACCFGLVPPSVLSSLLPRFLELLTSLPVSSQVLGPWTLIYRWIHGIFSLSFPPTLSRSKHPWHPRHSSPASCHGSTSSCPWDSLSVWF